LERVICKYLSAVAAFKLIDAVSKIFSKSCSILRPCSKLPKPLVFRRVGICGRIFFTYFKSSKSSASLIVGSPKPQNTISVTISSGAASSSFFTSSAVGSRSSHNEFSAAITFLSRKQKGQSLLQRLVKLIYKPRGFSALTGKYLPPSVI